MNSFFDTNNIQNLEKEIQEVYLESKLPWIIGYSGGKDSTVTAQLVWNALGKLEKNKIQLPIFIISSDTLVETPVIVSHITTNIARMNKKSEQDYIIKMNDLDFKKKLDKYK